MPNPVTAGSLLKCSQGLAPAPLIVLPISRVMAGKRPAATILDNKPIINIPPFGLCNSATNPAVIAARAAALGSPVPGPCLPVVVAPWSPGSRKMKIGGVPAMLSTSKCQCAWAGSISVTMAPAKTVNVS